MYFLNIITHLLRTRQRLLVETRVSFGKLLCFVQNSLEGFLSTVNVVDVGLEVTPLLDCLPANRTLKRFLKRIRIRFKY